MEKKHEIQDLKQMQALPLKMKIKLTQSRIRQWVNEFGEDGVYISFSGGKDSTVLLDIVRKMYPSIKAVYVDTGLEYPEIKQFVKSFDNVEMIRPKMVFKDVIVKYGYPMISKEVSECVQGARIYYAECLQQKDNPQNRHKYWYFYDKLMGQGKYSKSNPNNTTQNYSQEKYKFFLNAPFEIQNRCCTIFKKTPAHSYSKQNGKKPISAQMAIESRLRTQKWLQSGCNAFDGKNPISNPMSFWTEQDVLLYIKLNNLTIASVYGNVVEDNLYTDEVQGQLTVSDIQGWEEMSSFDAKRLLIKTTGCSRTGCVFCGFGLHLEKSPNRFERLAITHPKLYDYVMRGGAFDEDGLWKPDSKGLGYWFVLQWINVHGNFNIAIPDYKNYEQKYGTKLTEKHLQKG